MDYFLKASALIFLFYVCYKLLLQNETYFQSNRWFLLIGLFISTVLPLVVIPIYIEYTPIPISYPEITEFTPQQTTLSTTSFDYWQLLPLLYIIGTLIIFSKVIIQFLSLNRLFKNKSKSKQNNYVFIETEADIAPFSFFNRIVYNAKQFSKEELNHIITHEKVHAKQFHSIDVIIMQVATILFWFNPIIWLYKKALLQNLEFIADYEAQNKIECSKSYQTVLLKASLNQNQLALPTNFYQSLIKKRIIMLQKSKSKNSSYFKLAIIIPFLGLFLMSVNVEEVYVAKTEVTQKETKTETFTITSTSSDKEIEAIKNRLEVLANGLKIKFSDIKRNSNGEITNLSIKTKLKGKTKFNHNVTYESKSGKPIENIALKIENDELIFGDDKQEMVMRVTKKGVVAETLSTKKQTQSVGTIHLQNSGDTINMEIDSDDKTDRNFSYVIETEDTGGEKSKLLINRKGEKPLYVLNGKIVNENEVNFDTENIATIKVLKGDSAAKNYGEKGKNGVIVITSKKNKKVWISSDKKPMNISKDSIYFIKGAKRNLKNSDSIKIKKVAYSFTSNNLNTNYNNFIHKQDSTIVILNGKKTNTYHLSKINPENIKSISVLNGKQAQNAFIINDSISKVIHVTTKDGSPWKTSSNLTKVEYQFVEDSVKTDSPWRVKYNTNTFTDKQSITKSSSFFTLPKTATDKSIEANKKFMKEHFGIDVRVSQLRRNKDGEITKIKIALKDNKGQKASAVFESKEGIPTIKYGNNMNGELIINSN